MAEYAVSNQIAVYKTSKKLAEFNDKLKPALVANYAHIHAEGDKLPDGSRLRSCVGLVLQDYSHGTGNNTVRVTANLSPGFFPYALSRANGIIEQFDFEESKIFGNPDQNGMCSVTKVTIKRAAFDKQGRPRNYPWYICVENGKAIKEMTQLGGVHMRSGTYRSERMVYININDYDFFQLMHSVTRYIRIWELTNAPRALRDAEKLMEIQRQQNERSVG